MTIGSAPRGSLTSTSSLSKLPERLVIVAGTYDGVLAGWDTVTHNHDTDDEQRVTSLMKNKNDRAGVGGGYLKMSFAMAAHEGSVRCLAISSALQEGAEGSDGHSTQPRHVDGQSNDDNGTTKKKTRKQRQTRKLQHENKDLDNSDDDGDDVENEEDTKQQDHHNHHHHHHHHRRSKETLPPRVLPGTLITGGYDESLQVYNLHTHMSMGEFKTPSDLGSPTCIAYAPPPPPSSLSSSSLTSPSSTHALVGLTSGKIIIYKKRDWSIQHVLSGHAASDSGGGVNCIAVHPSGKLALSGGVKDGKLMLWDLTKGRLAYVHKLTSSSSSSSGMGEGTKKKKKATSVGAINAIAWNRTGTIYAFCYDTKVTARHVRTGQDLLDVTLPSRANDLTFIGDGGAANNDDDDDDENQNLFLAVACNDGSLPVLAVGAMNEEEEDTNARRAIMAIEPVNSLVAGDERFKCIRHIETGGMTKTGHLRTGSGYLVVTANSGGVISIIDLEGAVRMMLEDEQQKDEVEEEEDEEDQEGKLEHEKKKKTKKELAEEDDTDQTSESEMEEENIDEEIEEVAAEILESVRVGSGARITNIAVWSCGASDARDVDKDTEKGTHMDKEDQKADSDSETKVEVDETEKAKNTSNKHEKNRGMKRKVEPRTNEMDAEAVERARKLISQAKKRQKRKEKKKQKKSKAGN